MTLKEINRLTGRMLKEGVPEDSPIVVGDKQINMTLASDIEAISKEEIGFSSSLSSFIVDTPRTQCKFPKEAIVIYPK